HPAGSSSAINTLIRDSSITTPPFFSVIPTANRANCLPAWSLSIGIRFSLKKTEFRGLKGSNPIQKGEIRKRKIELLEITNNVEHPRTRSVGGVRSSCL